jgi:hypothetical protein
MASSKWKGLKTAQAVVCHHHGSLPNGHRGCRARAVQRKLIALGYEAGQYQGVVTTTAPGALLTETMHQFPVPTETVHGLRRGMAVIREYEHADGVKVRLEGTVQQVVNGEWCMIQLATRSVGKLRHGVLSWDLAACRDYCAEESKYWVRKPTLSEQTGFQVGDRVAHVAYANTVDQAPYHVGTVVELFESHQVPYLSVEYSGDRARNRTSRKASEMVKVGG